MNFTRALWILNIVGQCLLFAIILWRREHARYLAFFAFVTFCVVRSFVLLGLQPVDSAQYAWGYFVGTGVRIPMILFVLVGLFYWAVQPYRVLSWRKSSAFVIALAGLAVVSYALAALNPSTRPYALLAMISTMNRSSNVLLAGFVLLLISSRRMRRRWDTRERGILLGFLYVIVDLTIWIVTYHTRSPQATHRASLIEMSAFAVALTIWIVHFLLPQKQFTPVIDSELSQLESLVDNERKKLNPGEHE